MTIYRCHFMHMGVRMEIQGSNGPREFVEGFWLDSDLKYPASLMDSCHWIPPHKIEYIEADRSSSGKEGGQ